MSAAYECSKKASGNVFMCKSLHERETVKECAPVKESIVPSCTGVTSLFQVRDAERCHAVTVGIRGWGPIYHHRRSLIISRSSPAYYHNSKTNVNVWNQRSANLLATLNESGRHAELLQHRRMAATDQTDDGNFPGNHKSLFADWGHLEHIVHNLMS